MLANIRLGWKFMVGTNTLAYSLVPSTTEKKRVDVIDVRSLGKPSFRPTSRQSDIPEQG
jgi:hypothetical protein